MFLGCAGRSDRSRLIPGIGTSPQAVPHGSGAEALELDYAVRRPYPPFLIGPDGRLVARGQQGEPLEKAVAEALAHQ